MNFWEMANDPNGVLGWVIILFVIALFAMLFKIVDTIADVKIAKYQAYSNTKAASEADD